VIAFTDHGRLAPQATISRLNEAFAPFRVLGGIEIEVEAEHLVVIGVNDPILETERWSYPRLHRFVRQRGGLLILAHPFRFASSLTIAIQDHPPDAMEVASSNLAVEAAERIAELAESLNVPLLCNSDAHATDELGSHYNLLDDRARNESEVLAFIKEGRFTAVGIDQDGNERRYRRK
jgi:predicted metal-dependent phosphoesterase TrpH